MNSSGSPSVLAPSDVSSLAPGQRTRLGGRVCQLNENVILLCDAFRGVEVHLEPNAPSVLRSSSLIVVDGIWQRDALRAATIREQYEPRHDDDSPAAEHVRLHERGVGWRLSKRSQLLSTLRRWFDERNFLEVDTPQRVPSPGLDLHLDAFASGSQYLITSPEYQMKRLLAGGVPRMYQIVHCFRDSERGNQHNSEFAMLEWYRAFATWQDVLEDTEQLVSQGAQTIAGNTEIVYRGQRYDLTPPYERISVTEAFSRYAGVDRTTCLRWSRSDEDRYFEVLVTKVEPGIHSEGRPIFLTDFPASQASLARLKPDDPELCERFELYVAGMELCNGFGELTDPREQRERLVKDQLERKRAGRPVYPIDERFLASLAEGMPPSAGNAMGLDRLLMLFTDSDTIEHVLPFPDSWL